MADSKDFWVYLNGKLVRGDDAVVPIYDRGLQWGDAVYDTLRTYEGVPFKLDYRTDRLFHSLKYTRIDPGLTKEDLKGAMMEVIEANRPLRGPGEDFTFNYYISRASMALTNGLTQAATVAIFPRKLDFASFAQFYLTGAPSMAPANRRTPPQCVSPKAKIANKMNHNVAELEAKAFDPDAYAIMLDLDGNITECPGANFLFVSEGKIKVPDTRFVLGGADMLAIIELAEGMGIPCEEGTYTTYDLYNADEAFITSSSPFLVPVVSFNGLPIGTGKVGPMTLNLMGACIDLVGVDFVTQAINQLPADTRGPLIKQWELIR
jgi:branched-chain amino acid aminotransferase